MGAPPRRHTLSQYISYGLIDSNRITGVLTGKLYIVYSLKQLARAFFVVRVVEVVTLEAKSTAHVLIHLSHHSGKRNNQ